MLRWFCIDARVTAHRRPHVLSPQNCPDLLSLQDFQTATPINHSLRLGSTATQ
jgi:hypothetical protein